MPKFQQCHFYFGAAFSLFLKHNLDARPSLIGDVDKKTQFIRLCTDHSNDFCIYMKYTSDYKPTKKEALTSWTIPLTSKDKSIIENQSAPVFLFFICGYEKEGTGEIVVVTPEDYEKIKNQNSVTINMIGKRPQEFLIHTGKAQSDTFKVKRNAIEHSFQIKA